MTATNDWRPHIRVHEGVQPGQPFIGFGLAATDDDDYWRQDLDVGSRPFSATCSLISS